MGNGLYVHGSLVLGEPAECDYHLVVDVNACVACRLNQHVPNHKGSRLLDCVGKPILR
jgi:hypothetical protein